MDTETEHTHNDCECVSKYASLLLLSSQGQHEESKSGLSSIIEVKQVPSSALSFSLSFLSDPPPPHLLSWASY